MQDITSKRFLRIQCKDRKLKPYQRKCSLNNLMDLYYNNYKPPFEQYDKKFNNKHLTNEGGQKVWKL